MTEAELLESLKQQGITDLETLVRKLHEVLQSQPNEDDEPDSFDLYSTPWHIIVHTQAETV